jgi:hypothetical protein
MEARTRLKLIAAATVAAVACVAALAWWESGFPLRYVSAGRVHGARAASVRGRRGRDLANGEIAELCRLLSSARRIDDFQGPRSVEVELDTVDYGRVRVYDFSGPGANLYLHVGRPEEESCTVRSGRLGDFLSVLADELEKPAAEGPAP